MPKGKKRKTEKIIGVDIKRQKLVLSTDKESSLANNILMAQTKDAVIGKKKLRILNDWLFKKHRQYFYREGERGFCFALAKRLLEIIEHEPDHEIAKVLRKQNA
jgi:hypothetical protein